jgi:hypothetical protein
MKRKERFKTALIVLLTASAAFLAGMTGIFDNLGRHGEAPVAREDNPAEYTAAAFPLAAAYSASTGLRYGAKYSSAEIAELYGHTAAALSEALGSASRPAQMNESAWMTALSGPGLFLDYGCEIPLDALALWLGTELRAGVKGSAGRMMLSPDGSGGVHIAFQNSEGFHTCSTMSRWSSFAAELSDFFPNGAVFAFEKDSLKNAEKYELILETLPEVHTVRAAAGRSGRTGTIPDMSMSVSYTEADGTVVYPEDNGIVKFGADGTVSYTSDKPHIRADGVAAMIEKARSVLDGIRAEGKGDEGLYFTGMEQSDGSARLYFDYFIDGLKVAQNGEPAAEAVFKNGGLVYLRIKLRAYTRTAADCELLPELQAAAAAAEMKKGGSAALEYYDGGGELLFPRWTVH